MASSYEFYLTDDGGNRLLLLSDYMFFSYSRSVTGFGTFEIGLPFLPLAAKLSPFFRPDWRVDVWRSPEHGYPMRREQMYILRKPRIYTREDGVQIIVYYGRCPKDFLRRRYIIQASGTSWTRKTDYADDIMKAIVREQMLYNSCLDPDGVSDNDRAYPRGEFFVQEDQSLGPSMTYNFADRNVLDTLKEISAGTAQKALESAANAKIYFDILPLELKGYEIPITGEDGIPILDELGDIILDEDSRSSSNQIGYRFETFANLRGSDRTAGVVFSVENNNLKFPYYSKDYLDEINTVIVKGFGRGDSREYATVTNAQAVNLSRWNRCEGYEDASTEPDQSKLEDAGQEAVYKGRAFEELDASFISVPGGPDSPRSLYGIDWDLGDLLPVEYAGERFDVEVQIVYVAIDENGREVITGRNNVNTVS